MRAAPIITALFSNILGVFFLAQTASGGICWSSMERPGRCSSVLNERVSKEECCSASGSGAAWSEQDMDSGELFFWRALGGGAKCTPCAEPCTGMKCGSGRRCVVRHGRARCICSSRCGRAGPACGTDGRTYRSICRLRKRACNKPQRHLAVDYSGTCQVGSCNQVRCPSGKRCVLDTELNAHCVRCSGCSTAGSPLCAVDGRTYAGPCALRRAACELGKSLPLAYAGPCKEKPTCDDISCADDQVCVTGGISGVRCMSCGPCVTAHRPNRQTRLCGSDSRTYDAWCDVQKAMCDSRRVINVLHVGVCLGNSTLSSEAILVPPV